MWSDKSLNESIKKDRRIELNVELRQLGMKRQSPLVYSVFAQASMTIASVSLCFLLFGKSQAYSMALGMCLYAIPNLYFTHYAFRGNHAMPWIKQSFMFGEFGKLSLCAAGFALVFSFVKELNITSLFIGFALMIVFQWWLAAKIANKVSVDSECISGD